MTGWGRSLESFAPPDTDNVSYPHESGDPLGVNHIAHFSESGLSLNTATAPMHRCIATTRSTNRAMSSADGRLMGTKMASVLGIQPAIKVLRPSPELDTVDRIVVSLGICAH